MIRWKHQSNPKSVKILFVLPLSLHFPFLTLCFIRSSPLLSSSLLLTQSQQLWLAVSGKHCFAFLLFKKFPAPH